MDYLSLFYCLSSVRIPEPYVAFFRKNEAFLVGDVKTVTDYYLRNYAERGSFPDFPTAAAEVGFDISAFSYEGLKGFYGDEDNALAVLWDKFTAAVATVELKTLENQVCTENDFDKKKALLSQYTQKLLSTTQSISTASIVDTQLPIRTERSKTLADGILSPIDAVNDLCGPLGQGQSLVILAAPGSFKTTCALNIVYRNTIVRGHNCAYIYLEDMPDSYNKKVFSRYSYGIGRSIHKDLLLQGSEDAEVNALIDSVYEDYLEKKKGVVHYVSISAFSTEPFVFAQQFGRFVTENQIDLVVVDYAQRMAAYAPPRSSKYEYLNNFFSTLSALALGGFKNRPFASVILSQLTKEGIKKADKTQGELTISDAADISALERDAFMMLSLYANDDLKHARSVKYQVLKSRNSDSATKPVITHIIPEYCYFGDLQSVDSAAFSPTAVIDHVTDFGSLTEGL